MTMIGILDCNNFFVSCERLFRPDLRNVPVVVLSSNDGCIVARSKEIKDSGIPMGVPYFQVKDKLKELRAVSFSSHFALYRDISRRVFEVMREELEVVEQYSIDEAFFEVRGDPGEVAQRLKTKVERVVGIPVSIGIAASKTQAKYANVCAKKTNGITVIATDEWQSLAPTIPLHALWGVGVKRAQMYRRHGLETVADFLQVDRERVGRLFGIEGSRLYAELRGEKALVLTAQRLLQKSVMSTRSFKAVVTSEMALLDAVSFHVRQAQADLRSMGVRARQMVVLARAGRHSEYAGQGFYKEAYFESPTDDIFELLRHATVLTRDGFSPLVPYKKAGIILSDFVPATISQESLFAPVKVSPKELLSTLDTLHRKYGQEVIQVGAYLRGQTWRARRESLSPAYTTNWNEVAHVVA